MARLSQVICLLSVATFLAGAGQTLAEGEIVAPSSTIVAQQPLPPGILVAPPSRAQPGAPPVERQPGISPVQRDPSTVQVDELGQCRNEVTRLKAFLTASNNEVTKLKATLTASNNDLNAAKKKLAEATAPGCLSANIMRDVSGAVRYCGAYKCGSAESGRDKCYTVCNTSDWCAAGYSCQQSPAPGRCIPN